MWRGDKRGNSSHTTSRYVPAWQAEPSLEGKQAAPTHRATLSASPAESHMWATHIEVLENINIIAIILHFGSHLYSIQINYSSPHVGMFAIQRWDGSVFVKCHISS